MFVCETTGSCGLDRALPLFSPNFVLFFPKQTNNWEENDVHGPVHKHLCFFPTTK